MRLEQWTHRVIDASEADQPPIDVLILDYGDKKEIISFPRFLSFCFHEKIKDFVLKYSKSFMFIVTINYLNKKYAKRRTS